MELIGMNLRFEIHIYNLYPLNQNDRFCNVKVLNFHHSIYSFCVFCNNIFIQIRSCGREMNRKMLSKMCLNDLRCLLTSALLNKNCLILIISTQVSLDLR